MDLKLQYSLELPANISDILESDFWVFPRITGALLASVTGPVKFSSTATIFVSVGSGEMELNLRRYQVEAPCVVNIRSGEILQAVGCSPDFEASCLVASRKFVRDILTSVNDYRAISRIHTHPVSQIPSGLTEKYRSLMELLYRTSIDFSNPARYRAMLFSVLAFYYSVVPLTYPAEDTLPSDSGARLSNRFMALVQEHFREERFLDFYAGALAVTPKHLSRTIKVTTGRSAADWIESMVILEAKVLLKSSTLNVQQIAEALHFPSQSFFGKYFKKRTGLSPTEFRNS